MSKTVSVGLIQLRADPAPAENLRRTIEAIRTAAARGAQIICTQELFRSLYFPQEERSDFFDLGEEIPGTTTDTLRALAKELGIVLIASLFERRLPGLYHNTAAIIDADGSLLGIYRKMHIPDDPQFFEKYYFTPGDLGYRAWDTRFGRVGVLICWDQWYPEAARATALLGAQILFYPTAIAWQDHERDSLGLAQHDAWQTSQRAHAIANGVHVCAVNRVGREGTLTFFGQSFIADPFGRLLHNASETEEEIIVRELDLSLTENTRRDWPFLRDRRIETYDVLTKRAGV